MSIETSFFSSKAPERTESLHRQVASELERAARRAVRSVRPECRGLEGGVS